MGEKGTIGVVGSLGQNSMAGAENLMWLENLHVKTPKLGVYV